MKDPKDARTKDDKVQSAIETMIDPDREEIYTPEKKKSSLKGLLVSIAVNILVIGYYVWRESRTGAFQAEAISLSDVRPLFIALGVLSFVIALWAEVSKYTRMIMTSAGRCDRRGALNCVLIGRYADNVTPFGAGGQPFQIGYLHRRGYSAGVSSAVPIAGFLTQQVAFLFIALCVLIFNHGIIAEIDVLKIVFVLGLVLYAAVPLAIVLFAAFPKGFNSIIGAILRALHKIHIIKDIDKTKKAVFHTLDEYVGSLRLMTTRPFFAFRMFLYSLIYQAGMLSLPYFALRAFGGDVSFITIFSMTVYVFASITVIPTPGNAGAAEGSFLLVFGALESGLLFAAMLMWRALAYYSWVVIGLVVSTRSFLHNSLPKKRGVPDSGPLHIAQVIDVYFPHVDGVVRTVHAYARHMTEKGHDVTVICPRAKGQESLDLTYALCPSARIRLPFFAFSVPWPFLTPRLVRIAREKRFDVIHAHSPFMLGRAAVRLGRLLDVPVVATFHSKYYDDALHLTHSKILARFVTNFVVDTFCRADEVWACSTSTAETLRSYGYRGPVDVMDNGVDPAPEGDPQTLRSEAQRVYKLPDSAFTLLFVGQQIWHKNLRRVLDVTKALIDRGEDIKLIVAGEGYDGAAIKKYAQSLNLGGKALFVGSITDRRLLFGLYENADLFFFPSVYDNAPLVVREAALCGVPSLLVEGSNAAEKVIDGENGFTAKDDTRAMADKISEIMHSGRADEVGQRARVTIPTLWTDIADHVVEKYRQIPGA